MSRIRFSPESILWVVEQKNMSTKELARRERQLVLEQRQVERERLEAR